MLVNMVGLELLFVKLGFVGLFVCGFDVQIFSFDNQLFVVGEEGVVVICYLLFLGCLFNFWQDIECFKKGYLEFYLGYYFFGDGGYKDEDGYVYIMGCIDDIINVVGY